MQQHNVQQVWSRPFQARRGHPAHLHHAGAIVAHQGRDLALVGHGCSTCVQPRQSAGREGATHRTQQGRARRGANAERSEYYALPARQAAVCGRRSRGGLQDREGRVVVHSHSAAAGGEWKSGGRSPLPPRLPALPPCSRGCEGAGWPGRGPGGGHGPRPTPRSRLQFERASLCYSGPAPRPLRGSHKAETKRWPTCWGWAGGGRIACVCGSYAGGRVWCGDGGGGGSQSVMERKASGRLCRPEGGRGAQLEPGGEGEI